MKTEFMVIDPILSFPESFSTFSRAETRAKEMAESEPGKPVKIYELTGSVIAPVGEIQSLRVSTNGSGNGIGQRLIQSAKEAGYKRGPYKKKPSPLRIMNEIGLPIKEIPVKTAKKATGKRKYTKKASYWDNPIKKKRRKKRA